MIAARRLPGIAVDVEPPPAVEALPRMDVAVFVGFAETGPLHVPVVLESAREFAAVFGGDAPLAWDETRGERVRAYLGPAVRAFFAGGGRRCWVIRVARVEAARTNVFEVPGVLSLAQAGASPRPATAQARCPGSWSDPLRLGTALLRRSFGIEGSAGASAPAHGVSFRTRGILRPGDLVELGDPEKTVAYALVHKVGTSPDVGGPRSIEATVCAVFQRLPGPVSLPVPPDLARGRWASGLLSGDTIWLRADDVARDGVSTQASGPGWRELGTELPLDLASPRRGQVLTLDVQVTGRYTTRLADVGLTPQHPAAWWNQQGDAEFYRPPDDDGPRRAEERLARDVERFPLCRADEGPALAWVPLGVEPVFREAVPPLLPPGAPLERDGLAPFDASLFLDPELAGTPMSTLLEFADGIRYRRAPTRPLRGLHAALSIGGGGPFTEASLIAIPDALHLGWVRRQGDRYLRPHPKATEPSAHWRTHRGDCVSADKTPLEVPDFGVFLDCDTHALEAPVLSRVDEFGLPAPDAPVHPGVYRLQWTDSEPGAAYSLIESTQPDFSETREVYFGTGHEHAALNEREGVYYYRAYAKARDERSPGSNVVVVRVRADDYRELRPDEVPPGFEEQWVAIHRAALRLAAATGELFAVFAMPRHFHPAEAVRYARRLRAALGFREDRALSYGALYFPWLQSDLRTTPRPRVIPPDGPVLGVFAARASSRGAWIAAANEPMKDVVALTPLVGQDDWQALQDAQINLLRADPRGFLTLSADTLSGDVELRPINVRRLLTVLRRLALGRGTSYVFEPNGPALRRSVQRGFEALLGEMFRRGAFAGRTAADSFRVVTDDSINTPQQGEAGRFLVELHVAPSLPLRFITVRLAQSGPRLAVTEEL